MTGFKSFSSFRPTAANRRWFGQCARNKVRRRHGVAIVEFALIVPMLLLLSMGMIQGGVILNAHISLSNVTRDVGRYAAINGTAPSSDAQIKAYAVRKAKNFNLTITANDVSIGPPIQNTATNQNNRVQYVTELPVVIRCNISSRVFLPPTFMGAKMMPGGVLTSSTTVICE